MPLFDEIYYKSTISISNKESQEVSLTAFLEDNEDPEKAFRELKALVESFVSDGDVADGDGDGDVAD